MGTRLEHRNPPPMTTTSMRERSEHFNGSAYNSRETQATAKKKNTEDHSSEHEEEAP